MNDLRSSIRASDVCDKAHDAPKRETMSRAVVETIPPVHEIQTRLRQLIVVFGNESEQLREVGHRLRSHADELFGDQPAKVVDARTPAPARPAILEAPPLREGELGTVFALLAEMEGVFHMMRDIHYYVAEQAGRNCAIV